MFLRRCIKLSEWLGFGIELLPFTSEAKFKWIPKWSRIVFRARMPLHEAFTDCIT